MRSGSTGVTSSLTYDQLNEQLHLARSACEEAQDEQIQLRDKLTEVEKELVQLQDDLAVQAVAFEKLREDSAKHADIVKADFQFQLNQSRTTVVELENKLQDCQFDLVHKDKACVALQSKCQVL